MKTEYFRLRHSLTVAGLLAAVIGVSLVFLGFPRSANAVTVKYRPDLGSASPALSIYSPKRTNNAPVVVYVHGGAWQIGKHTRVHEKPSHFNRKGYVFVSIGYRLVPKVKVENQLEDIDHALNWIYKNISRYGGNKRNMHLMGHSAGAHLVSMTGVKPGKYAGKLIKSGALRTVISNDTRAYDIPRIASQRGRGQLPRALSRPFGTDQARWRRLSPTHQVRSTKRKPAFMILHSGQGRAKVRRSFADSFASRLRDSGARVTVFDGSRYSHKQINVGIGQKNSVTSAIDRFIWKNASE